MPWYGNNFPYTAQAIGTNALNASGVYAIWHAKATVYVGESNDLQRRLLEHRNAQGTCINNQAPTACGCEFVDANRRVALQDQLIAELTPVCNQ